MNYAHDYLKSLEYQRACQLTPRWITHEMLKSEGFPVHQANAPIILVLGKEAVLKSYYWKNPEEFYEELRIKHPNMAHIYVLAPKPGYYNVPPEEAQGPWQVRYWAESEEDYEIRLGNLVELGDVVFDPLGSSRQDFKLNLEQYSNMISIHGEDHMHYHVGRAVKAAIRRELKESQQSAE